MCKRMLCILLPGGSFYIGIILEVKGIKYFAPLSSFKNKHKQMKEGVDFIKIKDYAVINLNNMNLSRIVKL